MKRTILKTTILLFTTTFFNCEDNTNLSNDSVGNDTFSCKINGKLYIPSAGTGIGGGDIKPFSWTYDSQNNLFSIYTRGEYRIRITNLESKIGNNTINEKLNDAFDFSHSGMIIQNSLIYYNTKDNHDNGNINFSEFNANRAIGTFECALYNDNGVELKVTEGKFNLSLNSRTK